MVSSLASVEYFHVPISSVTGTCNSLIVTPASLTLLSCTRVIHIIDLDPEYITAPLLEPTQILVKDFWNVYGNKSFKLMLS